METSPTAPPADSTRIRVLLAIDDSECSLAAVQAVSGQFRPDVAEVHVFHAIDWTGILPLSLAFAEGSGPSPGNAAFQDPSAAVAGRLVEDAAKVLRRSGFKTSTSVQKGDARHLILEVAGSWQADVIVLGSHGRKGVSRLVLGSVAENVARHAQCSVVIVRERERR